MKRRWQVASCIPVLPWLATSFLLFLKPHPVVSAAVTTRRSYRAFRCALSYSAPSHRRPADSLPWVFPDNVAHLRPCGKRVCHHDASPTEIRIKSRRDGLFLLLLLLLLLHHLQPRLCASAPLQHWNKTTTAAKTMRSHLLSLLGLLAASAVAGSSESHLRLLQLLHGDAIAQFAAEKEVEARQLPVDEARHDGQQSSHFFLNDKTKRMLLLPRTYPW